MTKMSRARSRSPARTARATTHPGTGWGFSEFQITFREACRTEMCDDDADIKNPQSWSVTEDSKKHHIFGAQTCSFFSFALKSFINIVVNHSTLFLTRGNPRKRSFMITGTYRCCAGWELRIQIFIWHLYDTEGGWGANIVRFVLTFSLKGKKSTAVF